MEYNREAQGPICVRVDILAGSSSAGMTFAWLMPPPPSSRQEVQARMTDPSTEAGGTEQRKTLEMMELDASLQTFLPNLLMHA